MRKSAKEIVGKEEDAAELEKQLDDLAENGPLSNKQAYEVVEELRRVAEEAGSTKFITKGKHLDELDGLFNNEKLLREETRLIIHDKVSMKSYVDKMTKDQVVELRARIAEREFQIAAKQKPDFSSIESMVDFIRDKY